MKPFVSAGTLPQDPHDLNTAFVPPRPPTVPAHYAYDPKQGIWLPPSAISCHPGGATAGHVIEVHKFTGPKMPGVDDPNEPICFGYINMGVCSRLARGDRCRHRHLPPDHPAVIEDRVRCGKLPSTALEAVRAGDAAELARILWFAADARVISSVNLPPRPPPEKTSVAASGSVMRDSGFIMDPGPEFQMCFDYVTKGACKRLANGIVCRSRHLPKDHPDVVEYLKKPIPASTSGLRFKSKEEKEKAAREEAAKMMAMQMQAIMLGLPPAAANAYATSVAAAPVGVMDAAAMQQAAFLATLQAKYVAAAAATAAAAAAAAGPSGACSVAPPYEAPAFGERERGRARFEDRYDRDRDRVRERGRERSRERERRGGRDRYGDSDDNRYEDRYEDRYDNRYEDRYEDQRRQRRSGDRGGSRRHGSMDDRDRIDQDADPLDLLLSQRSRSRERSRERLGQREDSDPPPDVTAADEPEYRTFLEPRD